MKHGLFMYLAAGVTLLFPLVSICGQRLPFDPELPMVFTLGKDGTIQSGEIRSLKLPVGGQRISGVLMNALTRQPVPDEKLMCVPYCVALDALKMKDKEAGCKEKTSYESYSKVQKEDKTDSQGQFVFGDLPPGMYAAFMLRAYDRLTPRRGNRGIPVADVDSLMIVFVVSKEGEPKNVIVWIKERP